MYLFVSKCNFQLIAKTLIYKNSGLDRSLRIVLFYLKISRVIVTTSLLQRSQIGLLKYLQAGLRLHFPNSLKNKRMFL